MSYSLLDACKNDAFTINIELIGLRVKRAGCVAVPVQKSAFQICAARSGICTHILLCLINFGV